MGTIGIYDFDYLTYGGTIPNLECAKLAGYYKKNKQITVMAPNLEPDRYTQFFIRKEYDDGLYVPQLFLPNVTYGGRAFNPTKYAPMAEEIEFSKPDFTIYDKYVDLYGTGKENKRLIGRLLKSANARLSLDEEHIDERTINYIANNYPQSGGGIILHDYNLGKVEGAREVLLELSHLRKTKEGEDKPLPIGNKYPIDIYDSQELLKWSEIYPMRGVFYFRYHGFIDNEVLYEIVNKNPTFCRQIYYMFDKACTSEQDFIQNVAPNLYKQILFCKETNTRILLKHEDDFFKTRELERFVVLLNCYANAKWQDNFMATTQTLYKYCSQKLQRLYRDILARNNVINQYEMREIFQYIRVENYELFKMFYEWDKVYLDGGEFKNEWTRNQRKN